MLSAKTMATTITSIASWFFSNTLLSLRNNPYKSPPSGSPLLVLDDVFNAKL
jgi:hypothetical protein